MRDQGFQSPQPRPPSERGPLRPKPSAATTLEQLRRMTPEQLDAARICRRCWEHYGVCVCGERKVRGK
jgi:hypothetical protein